MLKIHKSQLLSQDPIVKLPKLPGEFLHYKELFSKSRKAIAKLARIFN